MIEIKYTILFFVCNSVLVQFGNGASSLRTANIAHLEYSPTFKRQDSSRFKVVKYLSGGQDEDNRNSSSTTLPNGDEVKKIGQNDMNQDQSPTNSRQQDEDYVMDRPISDSARLNESCSQTQTCTGDFVKCRNGVCACQENHAPMTDKSGNCEAYDVSGVALRGSCNRTLRCSGPYTECRDGICSCVKGYTVSASERDICRERVHIHMDTGPKTDPTMIGVIVGLALMSVTLCVVMRLFAKARFRENRTIFNTANPRLMNVSLKKVKKTITRSQGAHRGSQDSIVIGDGAGARHSAMQMNDRQQYNLNRPENTILSTSIDEEPTRTSSLMNANARNGNNGGAT